MGKWRKRFFTEGFDGLGDRKRSGRPRAFPATVTAAAKAIACELPRIRWVPLGRWSLTELRDEVLATGLVDDISTTTLWRWLDEDPIKPWRHRSWIFPRDPDFAARPGWSSPCISGASRVRGSAPTRRPRSRHAAAVTPACRRARRTMRVEHEYERRGTNLRLIHLPVHASWPNQVEIYFSIVQRKVLTPNDFVDRVEVQQRLLGFQRRYEQTAAPFDWRFTRPDLDRLLRRLDDQEQLTKAA